MSKTVLDFSMIASVVIGYFISMALLTTSFYRSRANHYLALSLFLLANLTLIEWGSNTTDHVGFIILANFRLDYLFAVSLFTYFLIQIKHPLYHSPYYKWIYLPFVFFIITEIPLYFFNLHHSIVDALLFFIKDPICISFNVFLIFYGRKLIKNANTISEDKRWWLLRLNFFILCVITIWVLTRIETIVFGTIYCFYVLWILMSVFLWWVLYYGIFKLQLIVQKEEIHAYLVSKKIANTPAKRKINSTTSSKIITQLYALMEEEEVYKDPLLSRLDLATRLNTSEGYLSQIVNQETNRSVTQFVNEYRIEAAKNLLHNPVFNKYSVEAIGLEAGFKSKSAFYSTFNTNLGMSPGAFRKLQKTAMGI